MSVRTDTQRTHNMPVSADVQLSTILTTDIPLPTDKQLSTIVLSISADAPLPAGGHSSTIVLLSTDNEFSTDKPLSSHRPLRLSTDTHPSVSMPLPAGSPLPSNIPPSEKREVYIANNMLMFGTKPAQLLCDKCGKPCMDSAALFQHRQLHEVTNRYACSGCDLKFSSEFFLQQHRKVHIVSTHPCSICRKVFRSWSFLAKHQLKHTVRVSPYGFATRLKSSTLHAQSAVSLSVKPISLSHPFRSGQRLEPQKVTQDALFSRSLDSAQQRIAPVARISLGWKNSASGIYFFSCAGCRKIFEDAENLRTHLMQPARALMFWCGVCGECFGTENEVKTCFNMHYQYTEIKMKREPT